MQNSGNFAMILVNYQFPRLVKPGAGNTHKRCGFLWYWDAPRGQDTTSSCDFQDFFHFYGFLRGNVFWEENMQNLRKRVVLSDFDHFKNVDIP